MKKLTIKYSQKLQKMIQGLDRCTVPLMINTYALITHVNQVGMTGKLSAPLVPIVESENNEYALDDHQPDPRISIGDFYTIYKQSSRMEVQVFTGLVEDIVCLVFMFYTKGKGNVPLLILEGAVDSDGIRYLRRRVEVE